MPPICDFQKEETTINASIKNGQSLIIIGAAIAGLATGCYAQMNGYQSQIFERHDKPGGLCTAWRRKDYPAGPDYAGLPLSRSGNRNRNEFPDGGPGDRLGGGLPALLDQPINFFHPRGQRLCQSHGDNKFFSLGPGDRRVFRAPGLAAAAIATPFIYNYDGSAGGSVVARPLYRPALAPGGRICPPDSSRFRFIPELPGHPLPGRFTPRRGESRHQSQKVRGWLQPGGPGESVLP